jgi:hypothetical protein
LKVNQGGCTYGDMKVRGLLGLAWWVTDHVRRGEAIDLKKFDEGVMRTSMIEARVKRDALKDETTAAKPKEFKYENWPEWETSIYIYLSSVLNTLGGPLAYVIRKDDPL